MEHESDMKTTKRKYSKILCCIGAFLLTTIIMFLLYMIKGYAPFGDLSLATDDANIQYLNLFAYLKDVINGNNSISYTLSKGLGGSGIAIFSYYLSSPFNFLVIFFEKADLTSFMDITIALKLGTAAFLMAYFLQERFQWKIRPFFILLLSLSYGLMQYNIAQSSNIMWLDGAYMLPIMLLGVYKIIHEKKPWTLFISTGLSILFNWYSAGINCLFTAGWFCLEWLLIVPERRPLMTREVRVNSLKAVGLYVAAMAGGVLLSACLFLPTLVSLSLGGRGSIDWSIFSNTFNGNVINIIQNFTLGSTSSNGSVSLFCGSFALLGCIGFFVSNKSIQQKIKVGIILFASVMIFYWQPLHALFSLLKSADSYWYRYSYGTIFLIIFIAADYYSTVESEKNAGRSIVEISLAFSAILLVLSWVKPVWPDKHVYYTCFSMILIAVFVAFYIRNSINLGRVTRVAAILVTCSVVAELSYNTHLLFGVYSRENVKAYGDYAVNQQEQIDQIQDTDPSYYRILQTDTYNEHENSLTANYDEAFAYHYWSIASYTSDPSFKQMDFLEKAGYSSNDYKFSIINTPILATDSLLGVKYVLSSYPVDGCEKAESYGSFNGKDVYYNPYVLPFAFIYGDTDMAINENANPFEYQNLLYSQFLGADTELYFPVQYQVDEDKANQTYTYTIDCPEGNYALYGNITWNAEMNATLNANNVYSTGYSMWESPSVFSIPIQDSENKPSVVLTYEQESIESIQFYALNLDKMQDAADILTAGKAEQISIKDTSAYFKVNAHEGDNLFISIPLDEGWEVTLNGNQIETESFADCFISIPLKEGENLVEMEYHIPYFRAGIIITVLTIALAILIFLIKRIKGKVDK